MYERDEVPGGNPEEMNGEHPISVSTCHPELNDGIEMEEGRCYWTAWRNPSLDRLLVYVRETHSLIPHPRATTQYDAHVSGACIRREWMSERSPQEMGKIISYTSTRTSVARTVTTETDTGELPTL
jgi:hypothetical protein